jgi:hypothetical protein
MSRNIFIFISFFLVSLPSLAEEWECHDVADINWIKSLVVASISENSKAGSIEVSGVSKISLFRVQGFNRRWDFGNESESYAFIIEPGGQAKYYDFSKTDEDGLASPSQYYRCRETKVRLKKEKEAREKFTKQKAADDEAEAEIKRLQEEFNKKYKKSN